MPSLTSVYVESGSFRNDGTTSRRPVELGELRPVKKLHKTTVYVDPDEASDLEPTGTISQKKLFEPPMSVPWLPVSADSVPLQIWEGTVLQLDRTAGVMHVLLNAKMGQVPRHSADIDLEWVPDQDEDLVRPGAVFYLTLYKRTRRGSIENSQELRFRRRPSWSPAQLKRIDKSASKLLAKMTALPRAE